MLQLPWGSNRIPLQNPVLVPLRNRRAPGRAEPSARSPWWVYPLNVDTFFFSPPAWLHTTLIEISRSLNHDRMEATVGPAERRRGAGMHCPICRNLERAYEARLNEYIKSRSSACFRLCTKLAARKNVEMERARYGLEEHRLVCASAVKVLAPLPGRDAPSSLRPLAA